MSAEYSALQVNSSPRTRFWLQICADSDHSFFKLKFHCVIWYVN